MDRIHGIIGKVIKNPQGGRGFVVMQYESPNGLVTAKMGGFLHDLQQGDCFVAEGHWSNSVYQGRSEPVFNAKNLRPERPITLDGAVAYLSGIFTEALHGVSRTAVKRFVDGLGRRTFQVIDDDPSVLAGLSSDPDRFRARILADWGRRSSSRKAVSIMEEAGLKDYVITRVLDAFRDSTLKVLEENPYRVAGIPQVGFRNADILGQHIGVPMADDRRLAAAIEHFLRKEAETGSTFADLRDILVRLSKEIRVDEEEVKSFLIRNLNRTGQPVVVDLRGGNLVASLSEHFHAEAKIAHAVVGMLEHGRRNDRAEVEAVVDRLIPVDPKTNKPRFDEVQRSAVIGAATEPFFILTGGPGTGKSTVMDIVARVCEEIDDAPIFLAAPTGKAAQRLKETTGRDAATVHHHLRAKQNPTGEGSTFLVNKDNPLPPRSVVVVDETSMLDTLTMAALVEALPSDGRLVLVGDRHQLASVGAGNVLADLLTARAKGRLVVPSVELEKVYRQAGDSKIALDAAAMKKGEVPYADNKVRGGVVFYEHDSRDISAMVRRLVAHVFNRPLKLDGPDRPAMLIDQRRDVAVLCPQRPGPAGAWEINRLLSDELNPNGRPIEGIVLGPNDDPRIPIPKVGDRVMLTKENDGENGVMNGDVGTLVDAYAKMVNGNKREMLVVEFDCGKRVEYPVSKWRNLEMAYAITTHKSQGSQYPVVILPLTLAHESMLERSMIYTGWTRAKKMVVCVGEREALERAVTTVRSALRRTRLREFIERIVRQNDFTPHGAMAASELEGGDDAERSATGIRPIPAASRLEPLQTPCSAVQPSGGAPKKSLGGFGSGGFGAARREPTAQADATEVKEADGGRPGKPLRRCAFAF